MKQVTFITGNQNKADLLTKYLDAPIQHKKLDLTEIQSLDLEEVVKDKAKRAYEILKSPVLVEDVSVEFKAMGKLPGTFIKFFLEEMDEEEICRMLDGKDRSFLAKCMYCYFDGNEYKLIEGKLEGSVAMKPEGYNGFGWDRITILKGNNVTRASLPKSEYEPSLFKLRPLKELSKFLNSLT